MSVKKSTVCHCVNTTQFRRAAVTATSEKGKELSQAAADLMGHMKATADKVYHVRRREDNALQAAVEMGTLMRKKEKNEHDIVSDTMPDSIDAVAKWKRWSKEENEAIQKVFAGYFECEIQLWNWHMTLSP